MIKYIMILNRGGLTRLARYYGHQPSDEEKNHIQNSLVRDCISRSEDSPFTFIKDNTRIVYKRYLALYVVGGIDIDDNALETYSFFEYFFISLNNIFPRFTEYDIILNISLVYSALDDMVVDGKIMCNHKESICQSMNMMKP